MKTLLVLLCLCGTAVQAAATNQSDRAWAVYQIFERSCVECHGGHKKPKGEFGHVLDLQRVSNDDYYVIKGQPEESELYLLLVDEDPDYLMPPADSDVPGLSSNEIQTVYDWVLHGAGLGTEASTNATASAASSNDEPVESLSVQTIIGNLHPLLVHFPIGLLLAGVMVSFLKRDHSQAISWCIVLGALGAVGSAITGWIHAETAGYSPETLFNHRWLGVTCAVLAIGAVYTHCIMQPETRRQHLISFAMLLMLTMVVGLAGHTGGVLIYGEGFPFR